MQKNKLSLNKIIHRVFIISLGWLMLFSVCAQSAGAQGDPVNMLRQIADHMIAGLKTHQATLKTKPQIVYKLAYQYVVPFADLPEMSKRVLPPQVWNNATPAQRAQFQREFTTTVIRTYASALTSYKDQTIQFYPVRGGYQGLNTVEVNSEISGSEGEPVRVSYRLINRNGAWRLYDMSVEGIDMLESFRAQFADILSQGNMELLLQRLSQHNGR
jgi:phospholipid transport system substrate-binding protein